MVKIELSNSIKITYNREISRLLGKSYWHLDDEVDVKITDLNLNHEIEFTIPQGYLTDGATVPRIVWSIIPVWDECTEAVLIHDYLCDNLEALINGVSTRIPRDDVDLIFLKALEFYKVNKFKSFVMYNAVRFYSSTHERKVNKIDYDKERLEALVKSNINKGYYK